MPPPKPFALRHFAEVTVEFVERLVRSTRARELLALLRLRVEEAVDRESIECVCDRLSLADDLLDRQRRSVVVVVVGAAAMAAELVEFADRERIDATIVERVEDRNAVRCERDRALHEVRAPGHGLLGELRLQRDLPRIRAGVRLRKRHLLLPGGDADHHLHLERRVRKAVRLDVEPALVEARLHEGREGVEDRGLRRLPGRRLFHTRLVDRANLCDALVRVRASVTREILERDRREIASARRDANLSAARKDERAFDRLARADVRPHAARRQVELVGRMRDGERGTREQCGRKRERRKDESIHAAPPRKT